MQIKIKCYLGFTYRGFANITHKWQHFVRWEEFLIVQKEDDCTGVNALGIGTYYSRRRLSEEDPDKSPKRLKGKEFFIFLRNRTQFYLSSLRQYS